MSLYFPNTTMKRYTYTKEATDVYGATTKTYEYADDIQVDLQNENNVETAKTYGVELSNLYKIYTDINTPLDDHDLLQDNTGNKYHIIGNIQIYNHFHNYKRAHLVIEREPGE